MLFTLLSSLSLAAQVFAATPADACREFSTFNPKLGVECLSMVSQGKIQEDAVNACRAAGQFQPQTGVSCLKEALNKRYAANAVSACSSFTLFAPTSLTTCFQKIEAKTYSKDEIQMCLTSGQFNAPAGIACMEKLGKKDDLFGCPSNEDLLKAVRNVRSNLRMEAIDFSQSMLSIMDQVMRQVDRAAMAEKTLGAIEFALQACKH